MISWLKNVCSFFSFTWNYESFSRIFFNKLIVAIWSICPTNLWMYGASVIQSYITESCEAAIFSISSFSSQHLCSRCYLSDHALFCVYSFLPEAESLQKLLSKWIKMLILPIVVFQSVASFILVCYRISSDVKYKKQPWGLVKNIIEKNTWGGIQENFKQLGKYGILPSFLTMVSMAFIFN